MTDGKTRQPRGEQEPGAQRARAGEPSAAAVADYLARHPAFLHEHPELVERLTLPVGEGRVVDLRAAMIERLRAESGRLGHLNEALIATSRGNLQVQNRVHQAVLSLLAAQSFEQLIERATTDLALLLDVDVASLGVEQRAEDLPPVRVGGVFQLEPGTVDRLIGRGREAILRPEVTGDQRLYGGAAGLVRSEALLRLTISADTPPAVLAFGSRTVGHFDPGQGTELLLFLARVLAETVRAWLDLPA